MVFESIVAELLNRFLGDYVENVDHSQLQVGIWGGDVVLQDLALKQSALDDLHLPVKAVFGTLGKLVLKIPWKNIYSAPVEASVEGLFLLVVPQQEVKYDPDKEEKSSQDAKKSELQRVEDKKKQEQEKDKPKPNDTFVEKIATQIIKNVQVKITDIHIRYEDKVTKPERPFSLGITLHNMSVHTTDENWKACVVQDAATMIYKVLTLEGLSMYWNPQSIFFADKPTEELKNMFKQGICTKLEQPKGYKYILGPINSSAQLRVNPKPESDGSNYTIPKYRLSLEMEKLSVAITRFQYHDLIDLLESFERMSRGSPYRKYRPCVKGYRGHYRQWWHFAYTCVLEADVRRRHRNWNWDHMAEFRQLCRTYSEAYQNKLTSRKVSPDVQGTLDKCEKIIDVLNLILIRQKIEMEVEGMDHREQEMKKQKLGGWFGGWFGRSSQVKEEEEEEALTAAAISKKFEDAMTPEEKAKLYRAIDYQENSKPTQYPKTFVEISLSFVLKCLTVEVWDDSLNIPQVLCIELKGVSSHIEQRPSADAIRVMMQIEGFTVFGLKQDSRVPQLITSKEQDSKALLDVLFETHPVDDTCDQRIHVTSESLKLVYDAHTINTVVDVFRAPREVQLAKLQATAESKLADIKEKSATGLQYAIQQQNILDLNVDLHAPYIIVPHGGLYSGKENVLVVNLGSIKITSLPRDRSSPSVRALHSQGTSNEEIMQAMISQSYDRFRLNLEQVQVLVAVGEEKWEDALTRNIVTPMHLLHPTNLTIQLDKCLITDDPRLPKLKITGTLPNVAVNITDDRLLTLITLFTSIPFPSDDDPQPLQESASRSSSMSVVNKFLDLPGDLNKRMRTSSALQPATEDIDIVQFTEMEVNFQMGDLKVSIFQANEAEKLLDFHLLRLEVEVVQKTYNMTVMLRIGGISLVHFDPVNSVCLLDTPMAAGDSKYLFRVFYVDVNKRSPDFHTKHGSVLKLVEVNFTSLTVLLHQESLLALLEVSNSFQSRLEQVQQKYMQDRVVIQPSPTAVPVKVPLSVIPEDETIVFEKSRAVQKRKRRKSVQEIDLKVTANLDYFKVEIGHRKSKIAALLVKGAVAGVIVKKTNTVITFKLKDIVISDPNPVTIHPNILSIMGEEAMSAQVVLYNVDEQDEAVAEKVDMSIQASMACLRIVFLNWFVSSLLQFLNSFQQAQKAIMNAAAGAAEAAKQNMQEAYEKAVKLSIDIKLQAPVVIIPVNSKSRDVLIMDFGNLTMYNKFKTLNVHSSAGYPAVVDELNLDLQNLKLSRAKLDNEAMEVINESLILQPITFGLLMLRNLSAGWYKEIPDIDLSGRLHSINITLSQEDFCKVMQVLKENFAEGAVPDSTTLDTKASEPKWNESKKSLERPSTLEGFRSVSVDAEVEDTGNEAEAAVPVNTSVRFTFTMESLIVDLFIGGSKELQDISSPVHLPENGLGRFTLDILSLKGSILSDGSIITSILLVDCRLDDTRFKSDSKIKRLMQRNPEHTGTSSTTVDAPARSMIDMIYQQKGSEMFVDLRIFGFTLTVCLSYLMKVADFFTSGIAPPDTSTENASAEITSHASHQTEVSSKAKKATVGKSKPPASTAVSSPPPASSMMTLNIRVEKPDIILVENMDDMDTNAIIFNNEITFKLRIADNHKVLNGSIKDLQLYSCCFNPERRKETMAQILHPCSISLAGSTPDGQGLHLDVCMTDIRLRVSPATIGLLSSVQRQLAVVSADAEGGEKEVEYSNIWTPKKFQDADYWFLKTEVGEDAVMGTTVTGGPVPTDEVLILTAPSVVVTVEAGVGSQTLPMILVDIGFQGSVANWSTQMNITSSLTLQMAYYNSQLALWEPLIEPVEQLEDGRLIHCPWELRADVHMNSQEPISSPLSQTASDLEEIPFVPPAMSIEVSSKENLELTMTKTCLDVLTNLGKAFQSAVREGPVQPKMVSPYMVQNDTGLVITLLLNKGSFKVQNAKEADEVKQVVLQSGAKVGLCLLKPEDLKLNVLASGTVSAKNKVTEKFLTIRINEMKDCELELPVVRADKRYFSLNHRGDSKDTWGLVSDVTVQDGGTIITLRSIIQVLNNFSESVNVYYMTRRGNEVECIGTVESGDHINLPLSAVYTPTNELFFSVKGYTVSVEPFVWKDLQNQPTTTKLLQCDPKNKDNVEPFFIKIVGEMEQVYFEKTSRHTMSSACYNIHLRPAVILKNFLPLDLICCIQGIPTEKKIRAGESIQMPTAKPGSTVIVLRIVDYLDKEWSCKHEIQLNAPDFAVWTFDSYDSVQKVSLDLGMNTLSKKGSIVMSLYCPFWMLNKTGVMLTYRQFEDTANVIYHPEDFKGPVLFSFRAKSFFGKKKASIKVEDGEWSDKFSLDVAGSSGVVNCTCGDTIYQVGVHIQLTHSTLTKQVVFMPYYVIVNNASYIIECQEADRPADPWIKVKPGECSPLWPHSKDQKKEMRVRIQDTLEMSAPFSYSTVHTTMLKLFNKYGGVNVDVQMTEGAVYVTFSPYRPGMAPALILNHTNDALSFSEKGSNTIIILQPREELLYAWENPAGSHCLVWNAGKKKEITDELRKDGIGEFKPHEGQQMWWVSFLDGMQRVLLFTLDMNIARDAQSAGELEPIDKEITVSIHGLGLSLVNNLTRVEVMYIGIASSGVIWETCKMNKQRFKPLSVKDCLAIEEAFVRYNMELETGKPVNSRIIVDSKIEVDFQAEEMLRPSRRQLRRTFQTGLWLQMKTSPHQLQLHAKVNRLQIDDQMYDCVFPVVLAPVPPPKSVAADSALKPFAELSIVQRVMPHSTVQQFKYFKVLIQEFHVKVDMGFINALLEMFESEEVSEAEEMRLFEEDRRLVDKPLLSHVTLVSTQEQKNFYDLLHFSPLKIHLSFSLSGGSGPKGPGQETPHFMNVLLQSLGVTLTDVQDVVFKLAYFERQYTFLTQQQLMSEVTMHYVGQSVKQLYVLVLGLDVIGNPYGLVLGFTQGVEDLFYEPFQGAIQGPGEFAEGLVLGVRSLFGHTVGGAAGAVSRITGAMGKGIAALTFDKDYQRKRREALNQRPSNVQTGLAQSGKGLVMGVVDGVSGVILKPISGAKQEGVEGFFKGVGKGVMGLVTRPTAGVIDFASGSLDAVKRAAEMSDEVTRLRPPRFFQQDGLVRPYVRIEAEGSKLLQELEKGRYSTTDVYVYHMAIAPGTRDTLMLTDKRVMYIVHSDIFGGWQVDWDYTWESLNAPPRLVEKGIFLSTGEKKKKVMGLFGHGESGKVILIQAKDVRVWLVNKMVELMNV